MRWQYGGHQKGEGYKVEQDLPGEEVGRAKNHRAEVKMARRDNAMAIYLKV